MAEFKAYKTSFQGEVGYMVYQFMDGRLVVEQFIPNDSYDFFCNTIGTVPESVDESEVEYNV